MTFFQAQQDLYDARVKFCASVRDQAKSDASALKEKLKSMRRSIVKARKEGERL